MKTHLKIGKPRKVLWLLAFEHVAFEQGGGRAGAMRPARSGEAGPGRALLRRWPRPRGAAGAFPRRIGPLPSEAAEALPRGAGPRRLGPFPAEPTSPWEQPCSRDQLREWPHPDLIVNKKREKD